jgi:pimeloyl-ACP methyl ester carboxylesterase
MAASVAHAQYHELTGGGHLLNTEMPDQCNRIISHFINGIESHAS